MTDLVSTIAQPGRLGLQIADAFMMLIVQGGELGELDQREIVDPVTRERRMVKAVPQAWLRRLERAVEVGAFAKKTPQQIAHRILTTPEAAK